MYCTYVCLWLALYSTVHRQNSSYSRAVGEDDAPAKKSTLHVWKKKRKEKKMGGKIKEFFVSRRKSF